MNPSDATTDLIRQLSEPRAYSDPAAAVEFRQTHISLVFLVGPYVYKVKKPVQLPFLDFSTLDRRRHFCEEEVRLNRRLAPLVYLDVVPIRQTAEGLQVEGQTGPVVEWAVKMQRLPDDATFEARLLRNALTADQILGLAQRIAAFHQSVPPVSHEVAESGSGSAPLVMQAVRDNLVQARQNQGQTIDSDVYRRLKDATEAALAEHTALLERRAAMGQIRDLHGDLHLDHIYLYDDRPAPDNLVIVDCIEFNTAFRTIDGVADMAFCAMDLQFHGRWDLAREFCTAYFAATGDEEGRKLLSFYVAYRAGVRGKVDGILAAEPEVDADARQSATARSRAYWLLALGALSKPAERPVLVLTSGLPGTGKSTLARALAESAQCHWIRSDAVRKELAAASGATAVATGYQDGIYTPEWTERTYAECLSRARHHLEKGERVVVDATFLEDRRRVDFLTLATVLGIPAFWMVCDAAPDRVRERLRLRKGDVSDADESIYERAALAWEPPGPLAARACLHIDANGDAATMSRAALDRLDQELQHLT